MTNRRIAAQDRGAATIELALVMPVFVGVIVGLVTSSLAVFAQLQLNTAAEEGARVMYLGGTVSQAASATEAAAGTTPCISVGTTGTCLPGAWTCTGNTGSTVAVRTERVMTIQWLAGSTDVTARGRGVTRCP